MRPDTQNGGRRRRGGQSRNRRFDNATGTAEATRTPKKLTIWQKILGFFGGGKSASKAPGGRPPMRETRIATNNREDRSNRGERPQRSERSDRFSDAPRESRKPELVEVTSPKLYVGNLSFDAAESDLFDLFRGVGNVQNAEIVSHRHTQKSKGFAFVMMNTVDEARRAVTELHDKDFMGRKLVVSGAKTSDVRNYSESDSDSAAA